MLRVLRQRDVALLWFAGLVSLTGDWILLVAVPITVYELTGSALATSWILIASRLPAFALGSVAGIFVDRWDRKRTMVVANVVRAPVLLLLFAVDSGDRVWIVYVVAFATSAIGQFFGPAENALLPRLIAKEDLVPANALNALNNNISRLIGPALGGVIAGWGGLGAVAVVDAASFLVAGAMIAAIAAPGAPDRSGHVDTSTVAGAWHALWDDWLAGLRLVRQSRALRTVFVVVAISSIGEGVMGTAFWVFIDEVLHGGSPEAGWLVSAQAIGGLAGSVVIGSWAKHQPPERLLGWGALGLGTIDLLTFTYPAIAPVLWPGLITMAVVGIPAAAFGTGFTTTIQTEAEDAFRGRVFGALVTTMALLMIVGAVIAGTLTGAVGPVVILSVQCIAYIVAGVFALRTLGSRHATRLRPAEPDVM